MGARLKIAKAVRELAMAHGLRVGRDSFGVYYVTDPATLKRVATTASHNATAAQGVAMLRRYLRQHRSNPTDKALLERPDMQRAVALFALATAASRAHDTLARDALKRYGEHGPQISGAVRDHFPADVKDTLRRLAREVTEYSDEARRARPRGVRASTMNQLASAVAARDGAGFYGPQPRRRNPRARRARARAPAARGVYHARFTGGGPRTGVTFQASSDAAAVRYATGLLRHKIGATRCVSVKREHPPSSSSGRRRRNPSPRDEAAQAAQALENFTGHPAKLRRARAPKVGAAGWVLGKLASVSYIATRDGETAEYVHKFRQRSRPQLLSTSDGSQLLILGGGYSVTERGIVDA
jgi:hypothetical protein